MSQIHAALSHYWMLRDQGVAPSAARCHVRSRFGVEVDHEAPLASTAAVMEPLALDPNVAAGFGEDFCKTITGVTSNPQGLITPPYGARTDRMSMRDPH